MIRVTTLSGKEIVINAELIEEVESMPETVITLTTGRKVLVRETLEEIMEKVIVYRKRIGEHFEEKIEGRDEIDAS